MVEDRARCGRECGQLLLQVAVAAAFAVDRDAAVAHPHRRARDDGDGDGAGVAVALHLDPRRVVAERLQRLAGFRLGLAQQVVEAARRQVLAEFVVERERDAHVLRHRFVVETGHVDAGDGDRRRRHRHRAAGEGDQQACMRARHRRRIPMPRQGTLNPACSGREVFDRGHAAEPLRQPLEQGQSVVADRRIVHVDHHALEERIHLRWQAGKMGQGIDVIALRQRAPGFAVDRFHRLGQREFRRFAEQGVILDVGDCLF